MNKRDDVPTKLKLEMEQEKHKRGFALMDLRRSIHADRANQLREQSAAMHRWVMASLLVLNTGAMVTMLSRDGGSLGQMTGELASWAAGAVAAIITGSLHSTADLWEAEIWQDLATVDYELGSDQINKHERDRDRNHVGWVRIAAGATRGFSFSAFVGGVLIATGYL